MLIQSLLFESTPQTLVPFCKVHHLFLEELSLSLASQNIPVAGQSGTSKRLSKHGNSKWNQNWRQRSFLPLYQKTCRPSNCRQCHEQIRSWSRFAMGCPKLWRPWSWHQQRPSTGQTWPVLRLIVDTAPWSAQSRSTARAVFLTHTILTSFRQEHRCRHDCWPGERKSSGSQDVVCAELMTVRRRMMVMMKNEDVDSWFRSTFPILLLSLRSAWTSSEFAIPADFLLSFLITRHAIPAPFECMDSDLIFADVH